MDGERFLFVVVGLVFGQADKPVQIFFSFFWWYDGLKGVAKEEIDLNTQVDLGSRFCG